MVTEPTIDEQWGQLASLDAQAREREMMDRYRKLAALTEDERRMDLKAMARAEYGLPDDRLRSFTLSRMRTWLAMAPDEASTIAISYDAIMREMPAGMAMKRVSLVQTLVTEFSAEDEERLRSMVPGVFAGAPNRAIGLDRRDDSLAIDVPKKKKSWWPFSRN